MIQLKDTISNSFGHYIHAVKLVLLESADIEDANLNMNHWVYQLIETNSNEFSKV